MFLENSELAPKLQQKKSPSNSEIVDFDHKPFLTMYKALLCQDGSSLILTCTYYNRSRKMFLRKKILKREMCCTPLDKIVNKLIGMLPMIENISIGDYRMVRMVRITW